MLDVSRVRSRAPQLRGPQDHYEPAPEPSAPPSSPPRTRRHIRRVVHRWYKLFDKVYKIHEQRRLAVCLSEHAQRYGGLRWERFSGESVLDKVSLVLRVISKLRKLIVGFTRACDRVRSAASVFERFCSLLQLVWRCKNIFGYTAAGAWVYHGVVSVYRSAGDFEEEVAFPRAPAEAPRPLLLE